MNLDFYVGVPLLLLATVIQASILSRFPVLGVVPPLLFLLPLAWGLLRGPDSGLIWAFMGGMLSDIFSASPVGLSFLTMGAAILLVTLLQTVLPVNRLLLPSLLTLVATFIYLLLYLFILRLIGYADSLQSLDSLFPLLLISVIVNLPVYWAMYWFLRAIRPRRVEAPV